MTKADAGLTLACEQRIVNAWPAPTTMLLGDWVVRIANGYSGRANSASAIRPNADLNDDALSLIEDLFAGQGLLSCVRATPLLASGLEERLMARGYRMRDQSHGMIARLERTHLDVDPGIVISPRPTKEWIDGVSRLQVPAKRNPAHLAVIVDGVRLPAAFATIMVAGEPAAFGMSVAETGFAEIGSVIVDDRMRGHGLGRRLVRELMDWAVSLGAHSAYLQVEQGNEVAIRLYETLGFRRIYSYRTLIRPG